MIFDSSNEYKLTLGRELFESLVKKQAVIEIKQKKLKRSLDANALMWVWLTCIQVETGQDKNEVHLLYRTLFLRRDEEYICKFLKPEVWKRAKQLIDDFQYFDGLNLIADIVSRSTTELESDEFSGYLKEIQSHARVNLNVILLNLDDQNFAAFHKEYGFR